MTVAFKNFASTTLAGGISAVDTSLTLAVTTGANFPATSGNAWFYLTLVNALENPTAVEIVKVTTRSGDTCSVIERAQDGTTAQAWPSGTYAQLRLTEGTFADLTVQYANNADNLSNLSSAATSRTNLGLGTMATQNSTAVAITGGTIAAVTLTGSAFNGTVGATTPSTIAATTISATNVITSTLATGTSPFTITSTTVVPNLNVSQLLGATWTAPGAIGSVTPSSGAFTTLSASGAVSGAGFTNYMASPPAIGGSTPAAGFFTTINGTAIRATTSINNRGLDNASATNSGFGEGVLAALAGGTGNSGVGNLVLAANTTGDNNTGVGYSALAATTTGFQNVAVGYAALAANKQGASNTAVGPSAMSLSVSATDNVAIGEAALQNTGATVTAGSFVIGESYTIQSAGSTVFTIIGAADNNPGTVFTATGVGAGTGTASSNTSNNIGIGLSTLSANQSGSLNIAIGRQSQQLNRLGSSNVSAGYISLYENICSDSNVAIGESALQSVGTNTAAGSFVTGVSYTIITVGSTDFTLIGAANNNIGTVFTASGAGVGTGAAAPNANNNTAIGKNAGDTIVTGTNNTIIGATADAGANQTNSTALGYGATVTADNQVKLGNASVTEVTTAGKLQILSGTAVPAGGTAGAGLRFSSTANLGVFFGSGVPTLAAAQGSLYMRTDGSTTSTRAYINTDGGTTWTAITTAT